MATCDVGALADKLNLQLVPPMFWGQAIEDFAAGDANGFVHSTDNHKALALVVDNVYLLIERGIYEAALLDAFVSTNRNNANIAHSAVESLFALADRERLLAAGDPLPDGETFVVYRGVAGVGARRRVRGYSWTLDIRVACWFAKRCHLPDPAVFRATIQRADVLAYCDERNEGEVVCKPERPRRCKLSVDDIHRLAGEFEEEKRAREQERIARLTATPL